MLLRTFANEDRSRSSLLMSRAVGSSNSLANDQTFSVETSTPATPSSTTIAASAAISAARHSLRKMLYPGVSIRLSLALCQGSAATAELMLSFLATSSSSKSVTALPSSGVKRRSVLPPAKSMADTKEVFPQWPCPINATFRIAELSNAFISGPPNTAGMEDNYAFN